MKGGKDRKNGKSARRIVFAGIAMIIGFLLVLSSCSSVFSAYIEGSIYDADETNADGDSIPIEDADVYLYADKESRDTDYRRWYNDGAEDGPLPTESAGENPSYFQTSRTDAEGVYSFSGFTWKELNPEFGKTADRANIYLLIYHKNYGLQKNRDPEHIKVVSEVSNTVPDLYISKHMNTATVRGYVLDEYGDALNNATVDLYIPENWEYVSGDATEIDEASLDWGTDPSPLTALTDADGEYSFSISYPPKPSRTDNRENTLLRLTFELDGYLAEREANPEISMSGFDPDDDGDDDPYYQAEICDGDHKSLEDISMVRDENESELSVTVRRPESSQGVGGVNLRIYLAEEWEYEADASTSDPDDRTDTIDETTVTWPDAPDYQGSSDADGEVSFTLNYPRRPDAYTNKGNTLIRIAAERDRFVWLGSAEYEKAVTLESDNDWEPSQFKQDNDEYFEMEIQREHDHSVTLHMKETEFVDQELTGYLYEDAGNDYSSEKGLNNHTAALIVDEDGSHTLADILDGSADDRIAARYKTKRHFTETEEYYNGWFEFMEITWDDASYTGTQSEIPAHILVDEDNEGTWDYGFTVKLYSNMRGGNYAELNAASPDAP
ncbi:MAG: hypothetical protein K9K78_06750 [Spirochaetales bacterium]|nr:hypothetical protein [Spirochaetales bacterium]